VILLNKNEYHDEVLSKNYENIFTFNILHVSEIGLYTYILCGSCRNTPTPPNM
jgi:hypothetical protein